MEYLEEAKILIFSLGYLTPTEQCFLCAEVAKLNFADWHTCEIWIRKSAYGILSSDDPQQEYYDARKRL